MIKRILTSFLATFLTISLVINCVSNTYEFKQQKNSKVNNFFVLGDSLSDIGNLCMIINKFSNNIEQIYRKPVFSTLTNFFLDNNGNNIIEEKINYYKSLSLPKDYYKQSSFSNGPVAAEIFAKKLGIELSCGHKIEWSINWPVSYKFLVNQKGNKYAIAGSKAGYIKELLESLINFELPLDYKNAHKHLGWKEWISQLIENIFLNFMAINRQTEALLVHHKIHSTDLFFVEIGGNDIFTVYEKIRPQLYDKSIDLSSLIEKENDNSICNLKESIEQLLKNGAKKIMLANCVNVTHTPFANKYSKKNKAILETITNSFNNKWNKMFNDFSYRYPSVFKKVDFNFICNKLLKKFDRQGFNITNPIADYKVESFAEIIFGGPKTPSINAKPKEEKDKYFFFDLIHPSAIIHHLLAEELYKIYQTYDERK